MITLCTIKIIIENIEENTRLPYRKTTTILKKSILILLIVATTISKINN